MMSQIRICDGYTLAYVGDIEINESKNIVPALPDDIVTFDKGVHVIKRAEHKNIVGILHITSRLIYGYKRNPIYLFSPSNRKYPQMYVASGLVQKKILAHEPIIDQYILVDFVEWKDKLPTGNCTAVIGSIDDINNEYEHILYKNDLVHKAYRNIKHVPFKDSPLHQDCIDLHVITIDPPNCRDIDDGISIRYDGTFTEIGVHIADVAYWIPYDSPLDIMARNRISSVYAPHKILHMLPDEYATNICSLLPNEPRLVQSVFFYYKGEHALGDIMCIKCDTSLTRWQRSKIISRRAYSYDEADKELKIDTHKLIETLMIQTNAWIAQQLPTHHRVLRVHKGAETQQLSCPDELRDYLTRRLFNSAKYAWNPENAQHWALQQSEYTHFTSPIRRYIDIIVQRFMAGEYQDYSETCTVANAVNKRINKAERQFKYKQIQDGDIVAYIVEIKEPFIGLYLPDYDLTCRVKPIHKKLTCITQTWDTNSVTIQDVTLNLYEKIDIHVVNLCISIPEVQLSFVD